MTSAREPNHPDDPVRTVAAGVRGVDLSSGASTIGRDVDDEMTTGVASVAKAYAGGFKGDARSPAGRVSQTPLMVAYQRHLGRLQAAKEAERTSTSAEIEALHKCAR